MKELEFSITKEEYEEFQVDYTMTLLKVPTYRFGQAFLNYFPEAENYLISNSHLGGNPGHVPNDSAILWHEKSYDKAKLLIEDLIEIT
jgi:hypothetical protein